MSVICRTVSAASPIILSILASEYGRAIVPPMLTFYNGASTLEDQIHHVVGKVLLQFGLSYDKFVAWKGDVVS